MSYEAWGDDDDGMDGFREHYRKQLLDDGWLDDEAAAALRAERDALAAKLATPPESGGQGEAVEYRLWDSQWVNVVNHERAYADWEQDAAIAHAVKLTEQAMAKNVRDGKWPPARVIAQGGGNER